VNAILFQSDLGYQITCQDFIVYCEIQCSYQ